MAALVELETQLQALLALKAPGVTKSRIAQITTLCLENIQSEAGIVQCLFYHFKKTPATHKLGVVYVVDAVVRSWIERAAAGSEDETGTTAENGSYAKGVQRLTQYLPSIMVDLISAVPDDQKEKVLKLIDIWERGNIFPHPMLSTFKGALLPMIPVSEATEAADDRTTTSTTLTSTYDAKRRDVKSEDQIMSSNESELNNSKSLNDALRDNQRTDLASSHEGLEALSQILPKGAMDDQHTLHQYLQLLQQLVDMKVPSEQWKDVILALNDQLQHTQSQRVKAELPTTTMALSEPVSTVRSRREESDRARSRSPIRRRGSPVYEKPHKRQRIPRSDGFSDQADKINLDTDRAEKFIERDQSLPPGYIKVLSRTLFVIGVSSSANELKALFSQFGDVQSFIFDIKKKYAFVKMYSRAAAAAAKQGANERSGFAFLEQAKETRWGAGYGDRDCFDYITGESILPINSLTEDEYRCAVEAENGGSGGKAIESGMVLEEPDIDFKPIPRGKRNTMDLTRTRKPLSPSNPSAPPQFLTHNVLQPRAEYDPHAIGTAPAVPSFGFKLPVLSKEPGPGMPPMA